MRDYSDILDRERPQPIRPRQSVENRAKLFMPFDALRGFSLALLTKEKELAVAELLQTEQTQEDRYGE